MTATCVAGFIGPCVRGGQIWRSSARQNSDDLLPYMRESVSFLNSNRCMISIATLCFVQEVIFIELKGSKNYNLYIFTQDFDHIPWKP